jgi:cysteinyl-tRNA synthetase
VRDVLGQLRDPEVLRLFLLSSHYRGPINYSESQLRQADETLLGLYRALQGAVPSAPSEPTLARFREAMDDDFNTPEALAVVQGAARELNSAKAAGDAQAVGQAAASLLAMGATLGLLQQNPDAFLKRGIGIGADSLSDADIERLLEARRQARAAKNFSESDRIRNELATAGVMLEDKPNGTTAWRRA